MTAIVEVVDLQKTYSRLRGEPVQAVKGLNLTLGAPGTVHGFLGPNGSGKTTTIRCLLGLIRPTAGTAQLFGADSATSFHEVSARVGAIVENPKMFPKFSGRKNLRLLAKMSGTPKSEVERVLGIVGLQDRGGDSFASYSLGMKQRLAIAAALLKNPDLLILDEPANGLDPAGIAEMRVLIRSIADEGKAILVSSHQLAEIEQVCDEVTIIANGELVESGSIERIRQSAGAKDAVVVTIAARDQAISVLTQAGLAATPLPTASELTVDIDAARSELITKTLADAGLYLSGLRTEKTSLEDAFLNLTGGPPPPPTAPPPTATPPSAPAPPPVAPPSSSDTPWPPEGGAS